MRVARLAQAPGRNPLRVARLLPAALLLALSACSGTPSPGAVGATPAFSPLPAPGGLVTAGTLTVASDPSYPPQEFINASDQFEGFDIDLIRAIAARMGLRVQPVNINVNDQVAGFTDPAHRYDMAISAQPETASLNSSAHTLEYFVSGQSMMVPVADPHHVRSVDSLCGLLVGAARGSTGEDAMNRLNEGACRARPLLYRPYPEDTAGLADLRAGKLDAFVDDYPVAEYLLKQFSGITVVPHQFETSVDVMTFASTDTSIFPAVKAAFAAVRADGTYRRLLARWHLSEGELH